MLLPAPYHSGALEYRVWDSSTHNATARSGGSSYSLTTSTSLASKSGSADSLKVSTS